MKNIVLIGMMGSGKTTVGRLLADALGRELVDTDALIEERQGRTIPEIFAADGEGCFRDLELGICEEFGKKSDLIVSCGGGLPMRVDAMASLRYNSIIFWLNRDPGETYDSLDISGRPLAQAGREDFIARYEQRAPIYRNESHHVISAPSAQEAARAIIAIMEKEEAPL